MAGLLFFLPGLQQPAKAWAAFEECGDSDLVVRSMSSTVEDGGPEGAGLLLGNSGHNSYDAKRQEWVKSDSGPYWIGYDKDARPAPADLERDPMLNGHKVQLGDGNYWLIPVARHYVELDEANALMWAIAFPQRRKFKDGHWTHGDVVARYRDLWAMVMRMDDMAERDHGGDEGAFDDLTIDDTTGMIVEALSVNYRMSAEIASLLDLIDSSHVGKVYHALTDGPSIPSIVAAGKAATSGVQPSSLGVQVG